MKVKVSEATNIQLDWMVAKAKGYTANLAYKKVFIETPGIDSDEFYGWTSFAPTTYWSQGGPIIEQKCIALRSHYHDETPWSAEPSFSTVLLKVSAFSTGPTPLVAAMRCYVVSELGKEVEVPDELA